MHDADERLKLLNIEGGFGGLDFGDSSFLSDRDETIDLVVRYRMKLPLPVRFLPPLEIEQRVKTKAWLGGDRINTAALDGAIRRR